MVSSQDSNPWPVNRKSDCLSIAPPRHRGVSFSEYLGQFSMGWELKFKVMRKSLNTHPQVNVVVTWNWKDHELTSALCDPEHHHHIAGTKLYCRLTLLVTPSRRTPLCSHNILDKSSNWSPRQPTACSGQLSLLPSVGRKMSSILPSVGYRVKA